MHGMLLELPGLIPCTGCWNLGMGVDMLGGLYARRLKVLGAIAYHDNPVKVVFGSPLVSSKMRR